MKKVFLLIVTLCNVAWATTVPCPQDRQDYFCIPKDKILNNEMDLVKFYTIPIKVFALYKNEISELSYPLALDAQWDSPYFGAGVSLYDNSYRLMILGGMARMKEMTEDAYAAIVCHEVGHILGGEPKQTITGADWASAEGQADFFSASQCLPRYFKNLGINNQLDISTRIEKAGYDFINLASKADSNPKNKFFKRLKVNMPEVQHTLFNQYPSIQCRYETFRSSGTRSTCWFKD